jgi:cephalosporin-C deacetylase-like acetyl esterase
MDSIEPADFKKYSISGLIKLYGFKSSKQFKTDFVKYTTEDYATFIAKMKNNG